MHQPNLKPASGIRMNFLFPALLFILNVCARSVFLVSEDISIDEPFSVYHAQFSFSAIIEQLGRYNNPPLYELLLHCWIKLFGISPLSVRFLPMLFASLCPVALYYFCRLNFSASTAVISSLLLTFSSLLMFYAHDSRVYSLFLLAFIMSMLLFTRILNEEKKLRNALLFTTVNLVLLYGHYFGVFAFIFQVYFLLLYRRDRLRTFIPLYLVAALLYLPQLYFLFNRFNDSVSNGTWVKAPSGAESLYNMLWAFSNAPVVTVICIMVLLTSVIVSILRKKDFATPQVKSLVRAWFLLSYLGLFFISYRVPVYLSRYLLFAIPAYYVLLALAAENLFTNKKYRYVIAAFLVLSFAVTLDLNPDKKHNPSAAISLTNSLKDSNTLVIVAPRDFLPAFSYHYSLDIFRAIDGVNEYRKSDSLLNSRGIFLIDQAKDLAALHPERYTKLICFAAGRHFGFVDTLARDNPGFRLVKSIVYKDPYRLFIFARRPNK